MNRDQLLFTCEHAGNRIPGPYVRRFKGAAELLASHRGWDPGALLVARRLARELGRPLLAVRWSRLLVEANRSPSNPRIWSPFTKSLPKEERERILECWWWPHRRDVETAVAAAIGGGNRVVHVAVHSFTPELEGKVRNAEVGLLYDSRRSAERGFCRHWAAVLRRMAPQLRLRLNYPYVGSADGLTTWLRRRYSQEHYLGIELEFNQALIGTSGLRPFQQRLISSLREVGAGV